MSPPCCQVLKSFDLDTLREINISIFYVIKILVHTMGAKYSRLVIYPRKRNLPEEICPYCEVVFWFGSVPGKEEAYAVKKKKIRKTTKRSITSVQIFSFDT